MEPREEVPKSNWSSYILPQYADFRWRSFSRMNPASFQQILLLVEGDPTFSNISTSAQAPVDAQLKLALWKLSHNGSASGFRASSAQWGVSEGHIFDCTKRVVAALFRLREQYIQWPSETARKRESIINDIREGFSGAVGKVDGTYIVLQYKPGGVFDGEQFFNRKKRYAVDLCAVCDSSKKFIHMLSGFSNATHDSRVWSHTRIHQNPQRYFSQGQYLLGDSAYTSTNYNGPSI